MVLTALRRNRIRTLAMALIWPGLYAAGMLGTYAALNTAWPLVWFNVAYLSVALSIGVLERVMPHEPRWLENDRQTAADLSHTLFNKGIVQIAAAIATSLTITTGSALGSSSAAPWHVWPSQWPMLAQVVLGVTITELGLYIAHRAAHEVPAIWRFHALHHSVERLWVVNTGRFHIVDTLLMIVLSQTPLFLMGAPLPIFLWISGVTAFTGLLTHCNIALTTGPLDLIFATPGLHRWHHSKVLEEGNRNYGENIMLWDWVFGTYFNPQRRPPAEIGIHGRIAPNFLGQLVQPFTRAGIRSIMNTQVSSGN